MPAVGNNLLTFMANRLNMSFTNLNCQNFGLTNPVTVTLDGNGAAIAATFNTPSRRPPDDDGADRRCPARPAACGHSPATQRGHHRRSAVAHHQLMDAHLECELSRDAVAADRSVTGSG